MTGCAAVGGGGSQTARRNAEAAKELRETRRDLEQVAAAAGTPVKKPVEAEDEVVDVDALKAENEALKAKLAQAEAKAAAAIDA